MSKCVPYQWQSMYIYVKDSIETVASSLGDLYIYMCVYVLWVFGQQSFI